MEKMATTTLHGIRAFWLNSPDDLNCIAEADIIDIKEIDGRALVLVREIYPIFKEGKKPITIRTCPYCGCEYGAYPQDISKMRETITQTNNGKNRRQILGITKCPWCGAYRDGEIKWEK